MQHEVVDAAEELASALQSSCLGVRVARLGRLVGRRYEAALRPLGLSVAQLEVLSALVLTADDVRPADLSRWLAVERSTMSRNLALMEKRGVVATTEISPTGRSQRVGITPQGRAALAAATDAWNDVQRSVEGALGRDAVSVLDTWLDAMADEGH